MVIPKTLNWEKKLIRIVFYVMVRKVRECLISRDQG
jgi:hypothetical protein